MLNTWKSVAIMALLLSAPAMAKCKFHKPKHRTEVCLAKGKHGYKLVKVPAKAAAVLVAKHPGALLASDWYPDADGDGFGDASAAPEKCPDQGLVDNDLDCNDGNAQISPDAAEVCGDEVDQNCDGATSEGCNTVACPCFSGAELDAVQRDFVAEAWAYGTATCSDVVNPANNNYTLVSWYGERYGNDSANESTIFYSISYDESGQAFCSRFHRYSDYDPDTGAWTASELEDTFTPISGEEDAACRDVIYGFAERAGLTCN